MEWTECVLYRMCKSSNHKLSFFFSFIYLWRMAKFSFMFFSYWPLWSISNILFQLAKNFHYHTHSKFLIMIVLPELIANFWKIMPYKYSYNGKETDHSNGKCNINVVMRQKTEKNPNNTIRSMRNLSTFAVI